MDIGELKNPYSAKKESGNTSTGSGLFKIGDYDEPKKSNNNGKQQGQPGLVEQAGESIKNGVSSTVNTLTGNNKK
ncbi:uncharacterized protein ATC70_002901 [Mucor velutinosus]|uniref:Uncharacterized protein n=1 Tax=Mucor velutinosus TaxID=708070 RepID=A0AAN7DI28_9FUNG|nr:hypothetical protein ATC70_002901 [Mucor velutinosus]